MSTYKTELQSNNTDLQSIISQIDELGTIVSDQDGIIAQIQSALRSSNGTTIDDIGVFTVDSSDTSNIQFLFIKGMTFNEWIISNMNTPFYDQYNYYLQFTLLGQQIWIQSPLDDGYWGYMLTMDGTRDGGILPDAIIEELSYKTCE